MYERKPKVFVVNGLPTSGKTTFEKIIEEEAENKNRKVMITSIIDSVKDCATDLG